MRLGYGLLMFECAFGMYLFVVSDGRSVFFNTVHSIDLDLLDFLALGTLVPWALAWAKDTFRYVGHCGLVFEEFRLFWTVEFYLSIFWTVGLGLWNCASWVFEVFV